MSQEREKDNSESGTINSPTPTIIGIVNDSDRDSQCTLDPESQINSQDSGIEVSTPNTKNDLSPPKTPIGKGRKTKRLRSTLKPKKQFTITSKYFKPVTKKWIPPKSPYNLVQESLFDNPWQLLIATIFLQKTKCSIAVSSIFEFLNKYPTPEHVLEAETADIEVYFKPLGLQNTRAQIVKKFSEEYLTKDWKYPRELFGIGKYGDDSYRIFCLGEWRSVTPHDNKLSLYHKFLWQNADTFKV